MHFYYTPHTNGKAYLVAEGHLILKISVPIRNVQNTFIEVG